jgi:hypothetical protein
MLLLDKLYVKQVQTSGRPTGPRSGPAGTNVRSLIGHQANSLAGSSLAGSSLACSSLAYLI